MPVRSVVAALVLSLVAAACRNSAPAPATPPADAVVPSPDARADAVLLAAAKVALPPPGIDSGDLADPT